MLSDFRFALRSLRATPAFTAVALIVLALGVGATTAIFSVVDAVALRGLPFERADRLMIVDETNPTGKGLTGGYVAAPNFYDWQKQQTSFEALAAFQPKTLTLYPSASEPEQLRGMMASPELFPILRVGPTIGRVFAADTAALKKADDGIPRTVAPIEEIQLHTRDTKGARVDVAFKELVEKTMGTPLTRADLQISRSRDGELFLTSRQDGWIRMLAQ